MPVIGCDADCTPLETGQPVPIFPRPAFGRGETRVVCDRCNRGASWALGNHHSDQTVRQTQASLYAARGLRGCDNRYQRRQDGVFGKQASRQGLSLAHRLCWRHKIADGQSYDGTASGKGAGKCCKRNDFTWATCHTATKTPIYIQRTRSSSQWDATPVFRFGSHEPKKQSTGTYYVRQ